MIRELIELTGAGTLAVGGDRLTLERWSGLDLMALDTAATRRVHAAVWNDISRAAPHPVITKTHDSFSNAADGGAFPVEATAHIVHLVRHPADVAASLSSFMGIGLDETLDLMADRDVTFGGPTTAHVEHHLGSWGQHAISWANAPAPRLTVRYEDLLEDTPGWLRRIAAAIGLEVTDAEIGQSVERCSFKQLRQHEDATGSATPQHATDRFFRKGVSGEGERTLSERQFRRVCKEHAEAMERFGYS